jgi:hypothetical protein
MHQQPIRLPVASIPAPNLTLKSLASYPPFFSRACTVCLSVISSFSISLLFVSYYSVLILLLLHKMAVQFRSFPVSLFYGVSVCIGGLSKI